jgi:hypothetical protein
MMERTIKRRKSNKRKLLRGRKMNLLQSQLNGQMNLKRQSLQLWI